MAYLGSAPLPWGDCNFGRVAAGVYWFLGRFDVGNKHKEGDKSRER